MQITDSQLDVASLAALGAEALALLGSGNVDALAQRFGYALAYGADPAIAIQADLTSSLASVGATSLGQGGAAHIPTVRYCNPNEAGLLAVVQAMAPTNNGKAILVELVVTARGNDTHITLEQISDAA
ncbi:hypothetical protein LYSHEL_26930 [Lysobacter helvus]|uniref:Uncharacterized protein n=2 Tax=Lysobacteraceae TaxID=32033 RepID=A0ABN6FYQ3_9GAMM|nr:MULTISPECIES: hypothetical protein [Lysobacter]BCT93666.1 hypothetical protein LYSCAS_26900 [Lysobacter caseinilyticus]BCT96822.1 hypothetical protein LYSHEL_26930 [Lysobacter helvus]